MCVWQDDLQAYTLMSQNIITTHCEVNKVTENVHDEIGRAHV